MQCRTGIKLKSYKGTLPCLLHFMCQRFTHIGLLLRLAALSSKAVMFLLVFISVNMEALIESWDTL